MNQAPDARLYIAPGCPHCPVVLQALSDMVKEGKIGRLDVINVALHGDQASAEGVRSAPWLRLGPFILEGAQKPADLERLAKLAGSREGESAYLETLLANGRLHIALNYLAKRPDRRLAAVLPLVSDPALPIQVKLGATALLEEYAESAELRALLPSLGELSQHTDSRVRTDACHLLGLTGDPAARPFLKVCLDDSDAEVCEVATESLQLIS